MMSTLRGIYIHKQNVSAWAAFFSCYTEVLQCEAFISTVVGDVPGGEMTGVDGLGGKWQKNVQMNMSMNKLSKLV